MAQTFPPFAHQTSYGLTGGLAGACTVPIESLWQRYTTRKPQLITRYLRTTAPALTYRGGVRFWVFDLAISQIQSPLIPTWMKGGLSGAAGGAAEICAQSFLQRSLPTVATLANQSSILFFCFGSYTYLSTSLSSGRLPPKPFWYCWLMGAAAGGLGSGIIAGVEGSMGNALWWNAVPKGALTIGTVIAVQVTSCAAVLESIDQETRSMSGS